VAAGQFDEAINRALDEYELMRRKAVAWDILLITARTAEGHISPSGLLDLMNRLVHPAQEASSS